MAFEISKILLPGGSTPYKVKDVYSRQHVAYARTISSSTTTAYKACFTEYAKSGTVVQFTGYENGMQLAVYFTKANTSSTQITLQLCESDGTALKDAQGTAYAAKPIYFDGVKITSSEVLINGRVYFFIYDSTLDGWVLSSSSTKLDNITGSYTYDQLSSLIAKSELVPGQVYRLIDYQCTTTAKNTRSAGNQFDLLLTADTVNSFSHVARAIQSKSIDYFSNCNLAAWEIRYNFYNDSNLYNWADYENGKGVIYYMKDEWQNEAYYDFKNIQYTGFKVVNRSACTSANVITTNYFSAAFDKCMTEANKYYYTFSYIDANGDICDRTVVGDYYVRNNSIGVTNNGASEEYDDDKGWLNVNKVPYTTLPWVIFTNLNSVNIGGVKCLEYAIDNVFTMSSNIIIESYFSCNNLFIDSSSIYHNGNGITNNTFEHSHSIVFVTNRNSRSLDEGEVIQNVFTLSRANFFKTGILRSNVLTSRVEYICCLASQFSYNNLDSYVSKILINATSSGIFYENKMSQNVDTVTINIPYFRANTIMPMCTSLTLNKDTSTTHSWAKPCQNNIFYPYITSKTISLENGNTHINEYKVDNSQTILV